MKIHYILMLQAILSLFGCRTSPAVTTESRDMGPFTVQMITTSGKTWNMNYGRVDYTNISYNVTYNGEPLTFDHLETNTALPGIWRVFHLKEAPVPALILGSQSLYLVTEENGKPQIKPLHQQSSDFASIQWLDSENGQPGDYREIYSSDTYDTDTELTGGRYMAISHAVVLDIKTFEVFPFNMNHEQIDGYYVHQRQAAGFSPDSSQVIYCGYKEDESDNMVTHLALVCYDFRKGTAYAVPFTREATYLKNESRITPEWVVDFFEWRKMEDHSLRLNLRTFDEAPPRKGVLLHERHRGNIYTLDPVKPSMMDHLLEYIKTAYHLDTITAYRIEGDYANRYYLKIDGVTFHLIYGEYGSDLVLKLEPQEQVTAERKAVVAAIAKGFNELLVSEAYGEEWMVEGETENE